MNVYYPWEAAVIGIGAGPTYHLVSYLVKKVKVDDTLDACAGNDFNIPVTFSSFCSSTFFSSLRLSIKSKYVCNSYFSYRKKVNRKTNTYEIKYAV